jgi:hypothetical protein
MQPDSEDYPMDVDPMGEWIAWTESDGSSSRTAIKQTASPSNMPPYYLQPMGPTGATPWATSGVGGGQQHALLHRKRHGNRKRGWHPRAGLFAGARNEQCPGIMATVWTPVSDTGILSRESGATGERQSLEV